MKIKQTIIGGLASSLILASCITPPPKGQQTPLAFPDILGAVEKISNNEITPQPKGEKPLGLTQPGGGSGGGNAGSSSSSSSGGAPTDTAAAAPLSPSLDQAKKLSGPSAITTPSLADEVGESDDFGSAQPLPPPEAKDADKTAPEPIPTASATPNPEETPVAEPQKDRDFFFLSYDDSASTAGVELTKFALNNKFSPNASYARPWEFLNFESFKKVNQESIGLFDVSMGMWQHGDLENPGKDIFELGVHISAPVLEKEGRKNAVLTLVIDVSGSMDASSGLTAEDGRSSSLLEIAKQGLSEMMGSLKSGDIVNIVKFSNDASTLLEAYQYNAEDNAYLEAVEKLRTEGGTNLDAGVEMAYDLALRHYDSTKINRVIMLTDAHANIGQVNSSIISQKTKINNLEGIYFSGLGFGQDFNEGFLNDLTEKGRGAYFSIVTKKDSQRAFQERFMALINVAAKNVQFRIEYPAALKHGQSAAEEVSKIQSEVQPTNFSFNTNQYFWEEFTSDGETSLNDDTINLSIFYTDPDSGEKKTEVFEKSIADLKGLQLNNIKDAHLIVLLTSLIKGDKSPEMVKQELDNLLGDHASALATEYRKLIESALDLEK